MNRVDYVYATPPKKIINWSIINKIFLIAFLILLTIFIIGGSVTSYIAYKYISDAPKINIEKIKASLYSKTYDLKGNVITNVNSQNEIMIPYNQIPMLVQNAVIATEDSRFRTHIGVDFQRIGSAILANVKDGFGSQGASTITQQVVKLSLLSPDKTLKRKIQEQWLAIQLERHLSKDEILEIYLNKIYYANNAYGIGTASKLYFDKTLDKLSLPQVALLAGLPQNPNNFNPYKYPKDAEDRKNIVLTLMERHGYITHEEAESAKAISVIDTLTKRI
jgi:penicillin-binding protein 1A